MMENGILLSLAAAAIYCVSGGVVLSSLRKRGAKVPTWMLLIVVAAVVLHGFALKTQIFRPPVRRSLVSGLRCPERCCSDSRCSHLYLR